MDFRVRLQSAMQELKSALKVCCTYSLLLPLFYTTARSCYRMPLPIREVGVLLEERVACSARLITRRVEPDVVVTFAKKVIHPNLKKSSLLLKASKKAPDMSLIIEALSKQLNIWMATVRIARVSSVFTTTSSKQVSKVLFCTAKELGQVSRAGCSAGFLAMQEVEKAEFKYHQALRFESDLEQWEVDFSDVKCFVPSSLVPQYNSCRGRMEAHRSHKYVSTSSLNECQLTRGIYTEVTYNNRRNARRVSHLENELIGAQQTTNYWTRDLFELARSVLSLDQEIKATHAYLEHWNEDNDAYLKEKEYNDDWIRCYYL